MARTLYSLLTAGIVLASALAALELGLWLDGRAIAQLDWARGLLVPDAERGWVGRSGATRWVENGSHDVFVANGEDGYRLPDPADRARATHHILVLGGSTAWGKGVGQGDTVSDWLRRELPDWVSVRSRALPGYSLGQIRRTLEQVLDARAFDQILLLLSPGDLRDGAAWRSALAQGESTGLPFAGGGAATLRMRLEETSRAARFLSRQWDRLSRAPLAPSAIRTATSVEEPGLAIAEFAAAHGARLVLAYAPTQGEVAVDVEGAATELRGQLEELAAAAGVPFLDLTDGLKGALAQSEPEELFDPEMGVWTHRSHFLAAHQLIESGLLEATRTAFPSDGSARIDAQHPFVQYSGRVDRSQEGEVRFDWPGVTIRVRIESDACRFLLRTEKGRSYFNVSVDGSRRFVFRAGPDGRALQLRALGPGVHQIEVQKRYQSEPISFSGLELPPTGRILAPPPLPERRIEVLGASVAAGMGAEGFLYGHRNQGRQRRLCADPPRLDDVGSTFGAALADWYAAEVHFTTRVAVGLIRNYKDPAPRSEAPFPLFFPRTTARRPGDWESAWQPDLVIVNLGENDFSNETSLDEAAFREEYLGLLELLRARYPRAYIIAFDEEAEERLLGHIASAIATRRRAGDTRVELVTYPEPERSEKGCNSHPTAANHRALAELLAERVEEALGWTGAE